MPDKYYSLTKINDTTAELYIFGDIVSGFATALNEAWGIDDGNVSGFSIAKDLADLGDDIREIIVHINSMGGYTAEGLAIYNLLRQHPARITTICDGFACSAASFVFMAGDVRIMRAASLLMIHNAWTSASGNAHELRKTAEELDKISETAANAYMRCVNITREELDALLDGEDHQGSWLEPAEALEKGFCTEVQDAAADDSNIQQSVRRYVFSRIMAPESKAAGKNNAFNVSLDASDLMSALDDVMARINQVNQAASEMTAILEKNAKAAETVLTKGVEIDNLTSDDNTPDKENQKTEKPVLSMFERLCRAQEEE